MQAKIHAKVHWNQWKHVALIGHETSCGKEQRHCKETLYTGESCPHIFGADLRVLSCIVNLLGQDRDTSYFFVIAFSNCSARTHAKTHQNTLYNYPSSYASLTSPLRCLNSLRQITTHWSTCLGLVGTAVHAIRRWFGSFFMFRNSLALKDLNQAICHLLVREVSFLRIGHLVIGWTENGNKPSKTGWRATYR